MKCGVCSCWIRVGDFLGIVPMGMFGTFTLCWACAERYGFTEDEKYRRKRQKRKKK